MFYMSISLAKFLSSFDDSKSNEAWVFWFYGLRHRLVLYVDTNNIDPEDGESTFLRNFCIHLKHYRLRPWRRRQCVPLKCLYQPTRLYFNLRMESECCSETLMYTYGTSNFDQEDGGSTFLRNIGIYQRDFTTRQPEDHSLNTRHCKSLKPFIGDETCSYF
jgi:hypothetical protein